MLNTSVTQRNLAWSWSHSTSNLCLCMPGANDMDENNATVTSSNLISQKWLNR